MSPHHVSNNHQMTHMVNHHMTQSVNHGMNQMCSSMNQSQCHSVNQNQCQNMNQSQCRNVNQNQQFVASMNTSCCGNYGQGMANLEQPMSSPAAAAPAPMQVMYQPPQARHCNCSGQHCNPHRQLHQCQPQMVGCRSQPSCACMTQCGMQQHNCMVQQHNCGGQQFCGAQYHDSATEKEEIQCGVVSQSSNNMRQAAYQRTLEYVEQCQSWAVSSSTHPPASNMIINDMNSSLNNLMQENKYFQMIQ